MSKVYLITGASSDIGLLLCEQIASEVDIIVATANSGFDMLSKFGKRLCEDNPKLKFMAKKVDLACGEEAETFISQLTAEGISPTHFVHLPALRPINAKIKKFDVDRFMLDFELQVGSAVRICKHTIPLMTKNKYGRILFMLSSYTVSPPKNMVAYVTVKSALEGLVKSLSADTASIGITVNGVLPSMIETKFLEDTPSLVVEAAAEAHPLGRNATVGDIVPAMRFLLSDDAAYITGTLLPITGGA